MSGARTLRLINQARILAVLYAQESASRAELARLLGLTRSALTKHVGSLVSSGVIVETEEKSAPDRAGRPGVALRLNRRENFFFGAEIGGQFVRTIALDFDARVIAQRVKEFDPGASPEHVVGLLKHAIAEIVLEERLNAERARGIGVAVSGLVTRAGVLLYSPALGWRNTPILDIVARHMGRFASTVVLNDANAAAFSEAYVERRLHEAELAYLLVDVGVGVGILNEGRLFAGADGFAGELGSLPLLLNKGPLGAAPRSLEAAIGRDGIFRLVDALGGTCRSIHEVEQFMTGKTRAGHEALAIWLGWLAEALVALTVVYDPREIRLGGRWIFPARSAFDGLLEAFHARLEEVRSGYPPPKVFFSALGEAGPAVGSACVLHERLFSVSSVLKSP